MNINPLPESKLALPLTEPPWVAELSGNSVRAYFQASAHLITHEAQLALRADSDSSSFG
tara:strand:- start:32 stop:208 length:177 start_codon:yes stop_codon:yes gene_type:complete